MYMYSSTCTIPNINDMKQLSEMMWWLKINYKLLGRLTLVHISVIVPTLGVLQSRYSPNLDPPPTKVHVQSYNEIYAGNLKLTICVARNKIPRYSNEILHKEKVSARHFLFNMTVTHITQFLRPIWTRLQLSLSLKHESITKKKVLQYTCINVYPRALNQNNNVIKTRVVPINLVFLNKLF